MGAKGSGIPNKIRVEGDLGFLTVARKGGAEVVATISREDVERVSTFPCRWYCRLDSDIGGYRIFTMVTENGGHHIVYLHRFVTDAPEGVFVDHIDRNTLNNTRQNLRFVTPAENTHNQKSTGRASCSGFRNVYRNRDSWRVRIVFGGKPIDGGTFKTLEEAVAASISTRKTYFTHCPENTAEGTR